MKQIIFIIGITISLNLTAQRVLNGDFEYTTLNECTFNSSNALFNSSMLNCFAFGPANEVDIQDSGTCKYYSLPANGRWFISLHSNPGIVDAVALAIEPPLDSGTIYQISYWQKTEIQVDNIDSLDSLLIGFSMNSNSFGSRIFSAQPMQQPGWTLKIFSFAPQINAAFITFTNQGNQRGWNFIDNIQINATGLTYTFNGNGNWTDPGNWVNNNVPPTTVNNHSTIIIAPVSGGNCKLDMPLTLTDSSSLTVKEGCSFFIGSNLDNSN